MTAPYRKNQEMENKHWLRQAFFVRTNDYASRIRERTRNFSVANTFYDTTLGGNRSMNPKYQYTRFADPKDGILGSENRGMGQYYNKAIDGNAQRIHLQFGVMEFNGLTNFLSSYYNYKQAYLANTGMIHSSMFTLGSALGFLTTLPIQVYFGINSIYRRAVSIVTDRPYSKFAYMKPTMPLYWTSATTLFNKLCADMMMVPTAEEAEALNPDGSSKDVPLPAQSTIDSYVNMMPSTFKRTQGGMYIDLKAVSSKGQRMANAYHETLAKFRNDASGPEDYAKSIQAFIKQQHTAPVAEFATNEDYLTEYMGSYGGVEEENEVAEKDKMPEEIPAGEKPLLAVREREADFKSFLSSELKDGSAWVSFIVENEGSVSESFSNTVKQSDLEGMINGAAGKQRDIMVNMAGGNIGDGMIADSLEAVFGGLKSVLAGVASSIGVGGLASLGGAGFIEMPKVYDGSSANLTSTSYKLRLAAPYGNKISILQDLYAPLCMLLAGVLPKSTGKSSYTSPFVCRLYSQGRADIKMGMIDSLTITRGTSNIGWSIDKLPTAIDIEFNIVDLNDLISMPVSTNIIGDALSFNYFDEDTPLSSYITSLAGLNLYEQYYVTNKLRLAWARTAIQWDQITSKASMAQLLGSTSPGDIAKMVASQGNIG